MQAKRSTSALAAIATGAFVLTVGAAFAAKATAPVAKGGTYSGALAAPRTGIKVVFKVSKNGRQVSALKTSNLPFYCSGGGPPVPIKFKNAKITAAHTFRTSGVQIFTAGPNKGKKGATITITGRFMSGHKESGTITTKFPSASERSCNGSSHYSTTA